MEGNNIRGSNQIILFVHELCKASVDIIEKVKEKEESMKSSGITNVSIREVNEEEGDITNFDIKIIPLIINNASGGFMSRYEGQKAFEYIDKFESVSKNINPLGGTAPQTTPEEYMKKMLGLGTITHKDDSGKKRGN